MKKETNQVVADKLDKLGPLMNDIGVEAAAIVGGDPNGLYIYAEPDDGVVYAAVFKDDGASVRYFDPTHELANLIGEAWELESADRDKRWAVLEYEVRDMQFHVALTYPEELEPNRDATERRQTALDKRYGDKSVIYPPMPEHLERLRRD